MVGLGRELNITMTSEREKRWSEIRILQHLPHKNREERSQANSTETEAWGGKKMPPA